MFFLDDDDGVAQRIFAYPSVSFFSVEKKNESP